MADVKIGIVAQDQASKQIQQVDKSLEKLGKTAATTSRGVTQTSGANKMLTGSFLAMAKGLAGPLVGMASLSGAVVAAGQFVRSSINDWVAYNEEVSKLSTTTTAGVEDLSRMMQAADDLGIEMGALKTAFEFASKNGVVPTIDNIAKLSDRMLAMTDIEKRNQEMTRIFGRGWADASRFLLAGSDAIKEGTAAIEDNLVVTQDSAQAARDYKVAIDNLQDAFTGVKNEVAQGLIPTLTDLMDTINLNIKADQKRKEAFDLVNKAFHEGLITSKEYNKAINSFNVLFMDSNDVLTNATAAIEKYTPILDEARGITQDFTITQDNLTRSYEQSIPQIGYYATATDGASKATIDLKGNMGNVTASMKEYNTQLLFTIASQDLDAAAALELARQLGLVDERTIAITNSIPLATAMFDDNADGILSAKEAGDGYYAALGKIDSMLNQLDGRKIQIDVVMRMIQTALTYAAAGAGAKGSGQGKDAPGTDKKMYANGTDFIIPPGYPNDSYPIGWGQSGERVIVIPKGQPGNTTNNWNLTVNNPANQNSVIADYRLMQALAGAV